MFLERFCTLTVPVSTGVPGIINIGGTGGRGEEGGNMPCTGMPSGGEKKHLKSLCGKETGISSCGIWDILNDVDFKEFTHLAVCTF